MSAFMCSYKTVQRCVKAMLSDSVPCMPCEFGDDLGRRLIRMAVQNPIAMFKKLKGLADEVGGMKNLLQIVTLLAE